MRGQRVRRIAALLAIALVGVAAGSVIRYRHAYGTYDVTARPVHLYVDGYRFEPTEQTPADLADFRPGAPHLHSVGTWSLLPFVGGRSRDIVTTDVGRCISDVALDLGHHQMAVYEMEDVANNPACGT